MTADIQPPVLPGQLNQIRMAKNPIESLATILDISERDASARMAQMFAMPLIETAHMLSWQPAFDIAPLPKSQQRGAILFHAQATKDLSRVGFAYTAVISNPFDADLMVELEHLAGRPVIFSLATLADIHAYLHQQEAKAKALDPTPSTFDGLAHSTHSDLEVLSLATVSDAATPAVRIVHSTLYDALRAGASDIHLEGSATGLSIKYRVDGVLDTITSLNSLELTEQVISRLKVMSNLDIGERRIPQDGSFRIIAQGRPIDMRVSIMPNVHGEDAVVRILDKQAVIAEHGSLTLDALGFDSESLTALRNLMQAAYGMLLVTGPTGSGKTTTLYAALSETYTGRDKIITIEDPVEYQLAGVLQIPVNEKKGLTFARGLRSILRHDPDKIMVGEIRDSETSEIAIQSALTGHLVLSTVHANSVFDVFGRFTHMGLDPYSLVSALNGIWAQRLVRLNCQHCSKPHLPSDGDRSWFHQLGVDWAPFMFMKGHGCGDCRGTGFRGRRAVAEILCMDDEIREMIVDKAPVRRIKEAARRNGTRSLVHAALDLVKAGHTTLDEVRRVTMAT